MRVFFFALGMMGLVPWACAAEISADMLDAVPRADVLILGEVHDNAEHHLNQARAVFSLQPKAVVWEQLSAEAAAGVPEDLGDPAAVARALRWGESGWPEFAMYYPIFVAARDARHYGAEVPRGFARRAVTEGALAVMPDGPGLARELPEEEQTAREAEQMAAHCDAMSPDMLPGMVQAQRLRDAYLAQAVLDALAEVGPPIAVITGSGHARKDWGVPAVLAEVAPGVSVLSVGQVEGAAPDHAPFDLWVATETIDRTDPCLAFR